MCGKRSADIPVAKQKYITFFNQTKKPQNMKLFLDKSTFISVIQEQTGFNCQIMELVHGIGMYPATIMDSDTVSCIVHEHPKLTETSRICKDFNEVADFHQECFKKL